MIDLRSDTVTKPTDKMLKAMASAEVGDDVYGEDPTVHRLEALVAEKLGKEAALFAPSGTQSNLLGLLAHCERGDEYIVGQQAHTYKYEGGGAAVFGSIQPQPIEHEADGTISLAKIKAAIKPDDFHFAKTRLIALENTIGGKVIPQQYVKQVAKLAKEYQLSFHLDGARLANASVSTGESMLNLAEPFDSVSLCLSKGLCAPIGSVLAGNEAFINKARRWRKMLGGGMRQAGIVAAAGIVAIEDMVERLKEDHDNAHYLAEKLNDVKGVEVVDGVHQTNMVFVRFNAERPAKLATEFADHGVRVSVSSGVSRLVIHNDINRQNVDEFVAICSKVL